MKHQGGQAFILVLILLAFGSLTIVPALNYVTTGLRSQRISENALTDMYMADSAVEDALWQLLNQFMGTFDPSNPQIAYEFQFGASKLPIIIKIPSVPLSQNYGTGNVHNLMVTIQDPSKVTIEDPNAPKPLWYDPPPGGGSHTFKYTVRFDTQQWTLTNFRFTLPEGLTYSSNSCRYRPSTSQPGTPSKNAELAWDAQVNLGTNSILMKNSQWLDMPIISYIEVTQWPPPGGAIPNASYLLKTMGGDGRQTLEWLPYFSATGNRTFIQTFAVAGTPPWGVSYTPAVFQGGFGTINIAQTAAMGVAMYTVLINVGGVDYQVVLAYDAATLKFKIISYQIM